jgi:hypothetical protein
MAWKFLSQALASERIVLSCVVVKVGKCWAWMVEMERYWERARRWGSEVVSQGVPFESMWVVVVVDVIGAVAGTD